MKTKSIYEPAAPDDGVRMLITRYYPRGVKKDRFDVWVKDLSPGRELLHSYKEGKIPWNGFAVSFVAELKSSRESQDALRSLAARSREEDVTLLCYEKEGEPCHRHIIKDIATHPSLLASIAGAERRRKKREPFPSRERFYSRRKVGREARK